MTKQHKDTSRTIKHLIQSAAKGNFESSFQLYKYYSEGKKVKQKDNTLAAKYLAEVESSLIDKRLRLKSLQLYQFRRFHTLNINFDEKLTVIIGDNGSGKTSIVEAIAKIFTLFNNNLEKEDANGRPVNLTDIHVDARDYAEVSSKFQFDKKNGFEATIGRVVAGYKGNSTTEVSVIKQFGAMYRHTEKNTSILIPLLAFYSVERSDFKLKQTLPEKASGDTTTNRFSALKDALEGTGKLDNFSELYIELVNLAEGESTKEIKNLQIQISTLEKSINEVYEGKQPPSNDPFFVKLITKKEELAGLSQSMSSVKFQRHLDFVNFAIESLVPDVSNLQVDRSTGRPRLLVENFGNKVNISQLSQGQKMLVALTGDLARRLVTLNPEADNPLQCHGIVVIDEIELHLHPKWQQQILIGLQSTFPKLQFIVTTHSPQVLSTVDNKCIRQICLDDQGSPIINTPTFQTKGVTSADILDRIMGINSIPEKLEEAIWINKFAECLNAQDKAGVESYLSKISTHFGSLHPVVLDCESQIRIAEMKTRLAKSK